MKKKFLCILTAAISSFSISYTFLNFDKTYAEEDIWATYGSRLECDGYSLSFGIVDVNSDGTYDERILAQCLTDSTLSEVTVEIPAEFNGLPVTQINENAFSYCKNLVDVTIPDSVESIYKDAFINTALLNNQSGIKYADDWVIGCDADIEKLELGDNIRGMIADAFSEVEQVEIAQMSTNAYRKWMFRLSDVVIKKLILTGETDTMGKYSFWNDIEEIILPVGFKELSNFAFENCSTLKALTFENPNCVIEDDDKTIDSDVVIYGYENSTAQAYAEKYRLQFVSLGESTVKITDILGDVNNDGKLNVRDAAFIASALAQNNTNALSQNADYNQDEKTNVRDAAAIANFLAKK